MLLHVSVPNLGSLGSPILQYKVTHTSIQNLSITSSPTGACRWAAATLMLDVLGDKDLIHTRFVPTLQLHCRQTLGTGDISGSNIFFSEGDEKLTLNNEDEVTLHKFLQQSNDFAQVGPTVGRLCGDLPDRKMPRSGSLE